MCEEMIPPCFGEYGEGCIVDNYACRECIRVTRSKYEM